jgi:hypothetical protein
MIWDREVGGSNPLALIFCINHLRVSHDARFFFRGHIECGGHGILRILFEYVAIYNARAIGARMSRVWLATRPSVIAAWRTSTSRTICKNRSAAERSKRNIPPHTLDIFARLAPLPAAADSQTSRTIWQNCHRKITISSRGHQETSAYEDPTF